MIAKYLNGSRGGITGAFGSINLGATGGNPRPYNLDKLMNPLFILNEYGQTVAGTNKQLQGMKDMLHSLPAPSSAPEVFTTTPNYNAVDQQYIDAEANLKNTPILGTSINQHIAQQQALGEQGVKLDHQRIQNLVNIENSALQEAMEAEQQNALSRHQTAEERRKFDMAIQQQIQDNEDAATAIKTDAAKKMSQEFYSLHKLKELKDNQKALSNMRRAYEKEKQLALDNAEADHDMVVAQEFKDQFSNDWHNMEDVDEFMTKYGVTDDEYAEGLSSMYNTDAYKTKFDEYKQSKEADWIRSKNQLLLDYDDNWWRVNGDEYWSYMKKGGKIKESSNRRYLSKNDRIAIDNNRGLHEFIKTMNQKQKEIFLKLMSI